MISTFGILTSQQDPRDLAQSSLVSSFVDERDRTRDEKLIGDSSFTLALSVDAFHAGVSSFSSTDLSFSLVLEADNPPTLPFQRSRTFVSIVLLVVLAFASLFIASPVPSFLSFSHSSLDTSTTHATRIVSLSLFTPFFSTRRSTELIVSFSSDSPNGTRLVQGL